MYFFRYINRYYVKTERCRTGMRKTGTAKKNVKKNNNTLPQFIFSLSIPFPFCPVPS